MCNGYIGICPLMYYASTTVIQWALEACDMLAMQKTDWNLHTNSSDHSGKKIEKCHSPFAHCSAKTTHFSCSMLHRT